MLGPAVALIISSGVALLDTVLPTVTVGSFTHESEVPPDPWHVIQLDEKVPQTRYQIIHWDGVTAIEASADASMALLARPLEIQLEDTPVLCWRWRVDSPLETADMGRKSGDDYAARVYVAFEFPRSEMSWGTRFKLNLARQIFGEYVPDAAINYVWDNRYPVGTDMPNAYTDRMRMSVVQSGPDNAGNWVQERRNVLLDARQAFGTIP